MSPDSVLHMLQRVLKRAGLERIRFHDLRHPYVKHKTKIIFGAISVSEDIQQSIRAMHPNGLLNLLYLRESGWYWGYSKPQAFTTYIVLPCL